MAMNDSSQFAVTVVTYTVPPEKAEALRDAVREHLVPAARRAAGYRGFLLLDQGNGKRMGVVVFDSAEHARAAQEPISIAARTHGIYAMMEAPSTGSFGTSIVADGIFPSP